MTIYTEGKPLPFSKIDLRLIDSFKTFLLTAPQGGGKSGIISQNTASTYFSIFKAAVHQAFIDDYLDVDLAAKDRVFIVFILVSIAVAPSVVELLNVSYIEQ